MTARLLAFIAELARLDPLLAIWARDAIEEGASMTDLEGRLRAALQLLGSKDAN